MKYVSIDIETTGLDPNNCQTIEIGAVVDDLSNLTPIEELPVFHAYIDHGVFSGEPFALSMHSEIFRRIAIKEKGFNICSRSSVGIAFTSWLYENGIKERYTAAGKNFAAFDLVFLKELPGMTTGNVRPHHRIIDPGIMFWHPDQDDKLPNLKLCKERAGIEGEVAHTAVEDALDVVKLVRNRVDWLRDSLIMNADKSTEGYRAC